MSDRCKIPGLGNDTYSVYTDGHGTLRNLTIPFTEGKWDGCHVYADVNTTIVSEGTYGFLNQAFQINRSHAQCSDWVFDKSVFQSTIATEVSMLSSIHVMMALSV